MAQVLGGIVLLMGAFVVAIFCVSLIVMGSVFMLIIGILTLILYVIEKIHASFNWIFNRKEVSWTRK